jgi:sugar O-acyltransferase (sialic acid O-acetyltransferase NeuD family)
MSADPIIIVGAGGHATTLADALLATGKSIIGFIDSSPDKQQEVLCGLPVLGGDDFLERHNYKDIMLVNGIGSVGDSAHRIRIQNRLERVGWRFIGVIHPAAIVSPFARIATDVHVLARAVVQPYASIEAGCIVNTGAIVEHNVSMGAWSHAAPGSVICGDVIIGERCHLGAGAVVMQGIKLGPQSLVGMGAAVTQDFDGYGTLVGVPAKKLER